MTLKELCAARYSCRHYTSAPLEKEKLEYIKECARLAPSAKNIQPWKFRLVADKPTLQKVCDCYALDWLRTAPAIVICMENPGEAWTRETDGKNHADIDVAIATEHICLAAAEQGLGSCWICNFNVEKLKKTVPLPAGFEPAALIPLGYAADTVTQKHRKPQEEVWL
ncbi:MAG: nitroreductase family protein [Prevotellaceae bacterium]|nr:nitroreductase family protein [Prevotellaceae bacterium]